jgi:hypothetical protein
MNFFFTKKFLFNKKKIKNIYLQKWKKFKKYIRIKINKVY